MKNKENTTDIRKTSLRMPESLARLVDAEAKEDGRSFNQMVNILVGKAVGSRPKEQPDGSARTGS